MGDATATSGATTAPHLSTGLSLHYLVCERLLLLQNLLLRTNNDCFAESPVLSGSCSGNTVWMSLALRTEIFHDTFSVTGICNTYKIIATIYLPVM